MHEIVYEGQSSRSSLGFVQVFPAVGVGTVRAAPAHFVSEEDRAAIRRSIRSGVGMFAQLLIEEIVGLSFSDCRALRMILHGSPPHKERTAFASGVQA